VGFLDRFAGRPVILDEIQYAPELLPYVKMRNYGKRVVKTPKLYFLDPGLACALTRQPNGEAAIAGPMGGRCWRGGWWRRR
jgi:predicted AAA+ superfamily ATPase